MSSIEITSRFRTIINRAIEMKFDKFVEDGIKTRKDDKLFKKFCESDEDPEFFSLYYKGLQFKMEYSPDTKYHNCDEYDEEMICKESHNCDCSKDFIYEISIYDFLTTKRKRLYSFTFTDPTLSMERVLVVFSKLPDIIYLCPCGYLAVKDKWCETCYIFRSEHPTDEHCAICHENEGVYAVTECKHYFHKHCLNQLKEENSYRNVKCPLCRTITGYISPDVVR